MNRERLPNRRASETFDVKHDDITYRATVSYYNDGRLGEVFVNAAKYDSGADVSVRESAISASLYLQQNGDPMVLANALPRRPNGAPSGPLAAVMDKVMSMTDV